MDFIVGLSTTIGRLDTIWVIVDCLTKSTHIIPIIVRFMIEKLALLYINQIMRLYGVVVFIVSK